jgi:RimJ/RimL family protein N-acetyltransferase
MSATVELLDAAIADPARLSALLGATLAENWAGLPEALPLLRDTQANTPAAASWGTVLFLLDAPRTLVGMGGYKGEPSADGVVEVGYAIAPAFQQRGLATAAARELVRRAFSDPRVRAVDAHTLAHENPSTRVLQKLGMRRIAEQNDAMGGDAWQWRLERSPSTAPGT